MAEAQRLLGGHARPLINAMTVDEELALPLHLRRWTLACSLMKGSLLRASSIVFDVPM